MIAQEESFQSYLRGEVETTGQRYDQAVQKVFALLETPRVQPVPELVNATRELSEDLRLYAGAIRRMASFACNQPRPKQNHVAASVG